MARKKLLILFVLIAFMNPVAVLAASPATHDIDIRVELDRDGGGQVTETWDVTTVDGTEFYLTKYYLQDQEITSLSVTDETGRDYTDVGGWDSSRSREAKDGQCGLIEINGGYEICWGIGSNYGRHRYVVSYYMTNLVKSYNDYDALYQQFVSEKLLAAAIHTKLAIASRDTAFTGDGTKVWGFGHTGNITVTQGAVVLENRQTLQSIEYVTALVRFDKGMFEPQVSVNKDFREVIHEAFQGSSYSEEDYLSIAGIVTPRSTGKATGPYPEGGYSGDSGGGFSAIAFLGSMLFLPALLLPILPVIAIIIIVYAISNAAKTGGGPPDRVMTKAMYANLPYCRDIPFYGSITATQLRLLKSKGSHRETDIIGAYILKWLNAGIVEIVNEKRFFKEEATIRFLNTAVPTHPVEKALFDMLYAASGGDHVLQSNEFKRWSSRNYYRIDSWTSQMKMDGEAWLQHTACAYAFETKGFLGFTRKHVALTPLGEEMTDKMYGFKKYLEEFTIIDERDPNEVGLWKEYLIFAQLFGIADKVAEKLSRLYPRFFQDQQQQWQNYDHMMTAIAITNMLSNSAHSGYVSGRTAAYSSSSSSSGGGGGGFSGGGGGGSSGGGSFGGGGTR